MSASVPKGQAPYYFVPGPSRHPKMAAVGLFFVALGAGQWVNDVEGGPHSVALVVVWWLAVFTQWFSEGVH